MEQTQGDTVLAFSDGVERGIFIPAEVKRACQRELRARRAALTFRKLLPGGTVYLRAPPDPEYDASRWWRTEQGLIAVFTEVIKLGFYWARYGITPF